MIPSAIVVVFHICWSIWFEIKEQDSKYEWFTPGTLVSIHLLMIVSNAIIFWVLCWPILFCDHQKIKRNLVLNALVWFLLPFAWVGYWLNKYFHAFHGFDIGSLFVFSNTIPYITGVVISFNQYRSELEKKPQ